jgi:hypothetical protein
MASSTGCPAWGDPGGKSAVRLIGVMSLADALARWNFQITDAWYVQNNIVKEEFIAQRLALLSAQDKNGDGLLCVAVQWGEVLNPNSHWALIWADTLNPPAAEAFLIADNHTGTSRKN